MSYVENKRGSATALVISSVAVLLLIGGGVYALRNSRSVENSISSVVKEVLFVEPRVTVPQGTAMTVTLQTTLSTKVSRAGDRFSAVVAVPVFLSGNTVIPDVAQISGHVVVSEQPGRASGRGHLQLAFDELSFDGHSYDLGSRSALFESRSGTKKDAALVGGGAVAGGIVGGLLGHGAGDAARGVIVGGAAGTVASLATRGPQIEFPQGTKIRFTLDQSVEVRPSRTVS